MSRASNTPPDPARSAASELRTNGYALFPNVLTPAQTGRLRTIVQSNLGRSGQPKYGGRYNLRGMNREPELAQILCSDAIIGVMKACIAPETPVLTGECDMVADTTSAWHKDITGDMQLGTEIFADEEFRVYKLAIYLQDQPRDSRATLKVRPGTHLRIDGTAVAAEPLPVHSGDVLVFDVRIDHAGQFSTPLERLAHQATARLAPALGLDAEAAFSRLRRTARTLTGHRRERLAVFMTFGPDSPALHSYERSGRHRHGPIPAEIDRSAVAALAVHGVRIIQPA